VSSIGGTNGSLTLGPIPDPAIIGKTTTTFEAFKARILTKSSVPPPPPPGSRPPTQNGPSSQPSPVPIDVHQLTLEQRLALQFGVKKHANGGASTTVANASSRWK